jgi:lipoic acid synthetase
MSQPNLTAPSRLTPTSHQRGRVKLSKIPIAIDHSTPRLHLPTWIRNKSTNAAKIHNVKRLLRSHGLTTVCEEAACPNLNECFNHGTATFMIMGDLCTRRCPFCDIAHGHPKPLDLNEPTQLARAVQTLNLNYVVITSVNRDDLRDGGATHFANCIAELRTHNPNIRIEILIPDFRNKTHLSLPILASTPPDVFNHNIETVPRLYSTVRPGADYLGSLQLLQNFNKLCPHIPIKSGLMLGLGETITEIEIVLHDLLEHGCNFLTIGQYLQPSTAHLPVTRFITPSEFDAIGAYARKLGFNQVASAPLVRSSYHAEQQFSTFFS